MPIRFVDVFKAHVYWRVSAGLLWCALLVGILIGLPVVLSLGGGVFFLAMYGVRLVLRALS